MDIAMKFKNFDIINVIFLLKNIIIKYIFHNIIGN